MKNQRVNVILLLNPQEVAIGLHTDVFIHCVYFVTLIIFSVLQSLHKFNATLSV